VLDSRSASAVAAVEARLARSRGTYDRLDALISPSHFLADLAATEVSPEKIHVVPNFVEIEETAARPERAGEPRFALFAGRLEEVKGVRVLMRAFDVDPPGLELRVAGTGPLEEELRNWAQKRDDVRILGMCPRERIAELMADAEALVVPSVWEENCPMIVLEARAAGLPVVCSDRGGLTELVEDGVDGLLVNVDDPGQVSAALRRLAGDPALGAELGRRGLERLRARHTAEHYYGGLMRAYAAAGARAGGHLA
jgi:glycosyltransferase involved in cell wall biosynthesis